MNKLFTVILIVATSCFAQNNPIKLANLPAPIVNGSQKPAPSPHLAQTAVRSFKEWKNEKVQIAIKKVTITKAQIEYKKLNRQFLQRTEVVPEKNVETEKLEAILKNDLYSLEVAQELGVTDYFAIYLTKQENKADAYKEAALKMSAEEVGELIKAYADSMFSSNSNGAWPVKVGPTAMEKPDNIK